MNEQERWWDLFKTTLAGDSGKACPQDSVQRHACMADLGVDEWRKRQVAVKPVASAGPLSMVVASNGCPRSGEGTDLVVLSRSGPWGANEEREWPPSAGLWHWSGTAERQGEGWNLIGEWTRLSLPALP